MTRHIRLPLGSTTTETHCGDCPFFIDTRARRPRFHKCAIYGKFFVARHHDCRAAEIKNDDGAIIRLLALLVRAPTDDDGRPEIECNRETMVDMAMAARRELDAMRARIKEEEVGDAARG